MFLCQCPTTLLSPSLWSVSTLRSDRIFQRGRRHSIQWWDDCCHLFDIQSVTCSLYLFSFFPPPSVMKWSANRPAVLHASLRPADEKIIKLLIFNFSFLSSFKKALSAARPQTDLRWLLFVQLSLFILHLSPPPPPPTLCSSSPFSRLSNVHLALLNWRVNNHHPINLFITLDIIL